MKWISIKDIEAPQDTILVFGSLCNMPHVAIWDDGSHCHTECCYKEGHHFPGSTIDFNFWMPLPKAPLKS